MLKLENGATNRPEEGLGASLIVYPNPFLDKIHLQVGSVTSGLDVRLLSLEGKELFHQSNMYGPEITLDFLPSDGVYFLELRSKEDHIVLKLIRQ
jgi:hypothetical protein